MRQEYADVIARVMESRLVDLHTSMPGTVESFDAATQCADVRPALTRRIPGADPEDPDAHEALPVLPCVPVLYPGSSQFGIRWPLSKGDRGLLVFAERDIGRWQAGGEDGDPQVAGMHSLAAAIFIPGDFSKAGAWSSLPANAMTLGGPGASDFRVEVRADKVVAGGETDSAALASRVAALETWANGHTHTTTATVGATATVGVVSTPVVPSNSGPFGSARLKVDS